MRSILILVPAAAQFLIGQESLGTQPNLLNGDMAALESGEAHKDIACTVTPEKALLGFDLKFHAGYGLDLPLRELTGQGNTLSILFRVASKGGKPDPVYFDQQFSVPPIADGGGHVTLQGAFNVGAGSYHVDWMMHDFGGRVCSTSWDFEAALAADSRQVVVAIGAGKAAAEQDENFQAEPPVMRGLEGPRLNVKVLMNFAPARPDAPQMDPADRVALISILRNLARSPQISKFSLVAFNIDEQRVLYRQNDASHIDFPELGRAVKKKLTLGTIDLNQLEQKHPDTQFLSGLVRKEAAANGGASPDGLIFVGPKAMLGQNVPDQDLRRIGDLDYPVFYMNYSPDPTAIPWKDSISRLVKFFKGREYTISGPKDLWNAVTEVVTRISKDKQARISQPSERSPQ